jgi:hypothetical protein
MPLWVAMWSDNQKIVGGEGVSCERPAFGDELLLDVLARAQ